MILSSSHLLRRTKGEAKKKKAPQEKKRRVRGGNSFVSTIFPSEMGKGREKGEKGGKKSQTRQTRKGRKRKKKSGRPSSTMKKKLAKGAPLFLLPR